MNKWTPIILLILLALTVGALTAFRFASNRIVDSIEQVQTDLEGADGVSESELEPGAYVVYSTVEYHKNEPEIYRYYRQRLGESEAVEFFVREHDTTETSGGLTGYIFGQGLLLHRFEQTDEQKFDAIISLEGEILETPEENWNKIRSANGRYEVTWTDLDSADQTYVIGNIYDTFEDRLVRAWTIDEPTSMPWVTPTPFLVSNRGDYFYARDQVGSEATLYRQWEVDMRTGEVTALHDIIDYENWMYTSIDPDRRRMLVVKTRFEPSNDGPGMSPIPPMKVYEVELDGPTVTEVYESFDEAFHNQWLADNDRDQFIARLFEEDGDYYLIDFHEEERTEAHLVSTDWVYDWHGDWLIVVGGESTRDYRMINLTDGEEIHIVTREERTKTDEFSYVTYHGIVTIE